MSPIATLLLTGLLAPSFAFAEPPGGESSCVACHRAVDREGLSHTFEEWEGSVHSKAGVTCEACHGGDASKPDAKPAHAGLRASTNPKSRLYFTAIPAACGACHQTESEAFSRSAHAKELKRSGRGPNCVTCHGSMANRVLEPRDLENLCTLCHRRPTDAFATLISLNHATASLERLRGALDTAPGLDVAPQRKALEEAQAGLRSALEAWHTFDLKSVLRSAQDVTKRSTTALNELKLKEQNR